MATGGGASSSPVSPGTLVGGGVTDTLCLHFLIGEQMTVQPSSEEYVSPGLAQAWLGGKVVRALAAVKPLGLSGPGAWASVCGLSGGDADGDRMMI